jgi:phosphoenolpyruvate carboxykinase (GTP)
LRVLRWVIERSKGGGQADETPIGYVPKSSSLNGDGLGISKSDLDQLVTVDRESWKANLKSQGDYFDKFGDHLPSGIKQEHKALAERLKG